MGRVMVAAQRLSCGSTLSAAAVPGFLRGAQAVAARRAVSEEEAPSGAWGLHVVRNSVALDVR